MGGNIIIHYGEIGLKGKNRPFFERKLVENIKRSLSDQKFTKVKKGYGRILVELNDRSSPKQIVQRLQQVFGITNLAVATKAKNDMDAIKSVAQEVLPKRLKTFRVTARRSNKNFPLDSQEVNEELGGYILEKRPGAKVNLSHPETNIYVEIAGEGVFVYSEKLPGLGGLPVGVSGRVVSLLSSGFDSPIASYRLMKRGARVVFAHFHSYPQTDKRSLENVQKIVGLLDQYQSKSKLFLVPFLDIQKEIYAKAAAPDRVVLYRRMMIRISEIIARQERAEALVTGDSLGQVASQTLTNMSTIGEVATMPLLRPLVGLDKEEIMQKARQIGTYDISAQPDEDCCSLFVPKNPNTKTNIADIKKQEEKLAINDLVEKAVESVKIEVVTSLNNKKR
ncbi:tRNA 4-thiouridine(8) synthase ThiI [Patescibacteria group bacterium]|nr:tRNA 4-thiouridine(8) synthase ThiI [Patescibacteria group bacterium]